mmetsp:Transcript_24338/g.29939  ORF Transcript_24338/g.29939 Transcript_24338/m.29939 type:complete len:315 (+) Transcript_24338:59-1003(+)
MKLLLTFLTIIPSVTTAFSVCSSPKSSMTTHSRFSRLYAEGGAPQYDKLDATLSRVDMFGEGTAMLHIETSDTIDYKAGHVIALEIESTDTYTSEKTSEDVSKNGGWMRGPYTISRASPNSFDILLRIVGDKSKTLSFSKPGTPVRFGGKFKVPIIDGINKEDTKRVVLISTGVGVGPCIGAIEEAVKDASFPPIELYASYREEEDIVDAKHLDSLDVKWKPIVTSKMGRISNEENVSVVLPSSDLNLSLNDTHYHLIGNGQMVNEWKEGLTKAGVPEDKITVEMYFNHKSTPDSDAINNIANVIPKNVISLAM